MNEAHLGVIINFRRGPKSQRNRECLIKVLDIEPMESSKLIGWKVGWPIDEPRVFGMISKPHGRTGTLRVKFKKGIPGQALSTKVRIFARARTESPKAPILEIREIKGVGKATEEKLRRAGFNTVESIASVDAGTVSEKIGVSLKVAAKLIASAKEFLE